MSKTDRSAPSKKPAADGPPESLDQVRDILFGGQMRTVETRLKGVEERLSREQDAMRAEFAKRVADLDTLTKREVQALHERIAAESDARTAALKALVADLRDVQKSAAAELAKASDRIRAELAKAVEELQHAKTDRAALAALLADVATRLADNLSKGGKGGKG